MLVISHAVGEDIVGWAAIAVALELVERLRQGMGGKEGKNADSYDNAPHERFSSLDSEILGRLWTMIIEYLGLSRPGRRRGHDRKAAKPAVSGMPASGLLLRGNPTLPERIGTSRSCHNWTS